MTNGTSLYHIGVDVCWKENTGDNGSVCARAVIQSLLAAVTFVFCIAKVYRIHAGYYIEKYHLGVFYLASLESFILFLQWSYVKDIILHFLAVYLHVLEFLLISLFYCGLAMKVTSQRHLVARVQFPFGVIMFIYFTGVLVYTLSSIEKNETECYRPHWLLFSVSQFVLAQMFLVAGYFLGRELEKAIAATQYKRFKQRTLWSLILAFEVSALVTLSYDITLALSHECDGLFGSPRSAVYIISSLLRRIVGVLTPIWIMIWRLKAAGIQRNNDSVNKNNSVMSSTFATTEVSTHYSTESGPAFLFEDFDFVVEDRQYTLSAPLLTTEERLQAESEGNAHNINTPRSEEVAW